MRFSKKRKAEMRKYRERRIRKNTGPGWVYSGWRDFETDEYFDILDIARFGGHCYLLVEETDTNTFAIYKKVHECNSESVKLSPKKVLLNKKAFEHPSTWQEKSKVIISDDGIITSVEEHKYKYTSKKKSSCTGWIIIVDAY